MDKLRFNPEACKSCGYCVEICPKGILELGEGVNKKGYHYVVAKSQENCVSCAMCATVCPDCVIEVWK